MAEDNKEKFEFPDLKAKYLEYYEKNQVLTVFLTGMFLMMFICIICAIITRGTSFLGMLHSFPTYVFMDHFSMVVDSMDHPYTWHGEIYPPLGILFYGTIGHFTMPFMAGTYASTWDLACAMRDTSMPMMVFLVFILAVVMSFYILYQKFTEKDFTHNEFNAIFIALLFSYPVLFGLSTGNYIFLCVLFCVLYLYLYDSENKWVRYFAYICLGCAAGLKVTPAFLAVLTLKRKGWIELIKCVIIVTLLLIGPFIFTDGNPLTYFQNTLNYASTVPSTFGFLNIADIMNALGMGIWSLVLIEVIVLVVFMILILFDKEMERWEEATLLGAMLMLIFSVSVSYTYIYMVLGLVLLLTSHKFLENKGMWLVVICFVAVLADYPGFWVGQNYVGSIKLVFLGIMVLYLLIMSIRRVVGSFKTGTFKPTALFKREPKEKSTKRQSKPLKKQDDKKKPVKKKNDQSNRKSKPKKTRS